MTQTTPEEATEAAPAADPLEQSLQIIAKVCAERNGNLADHQAIQAALAVVVNAARAGRPPATNGAAPKPNRASRRAKSPRAKVAAVPDPK